MRKALRYSALVLAAVATLGVTGHDHELCEGFVPENDMRIPVGYQHKMSIPGEVRGGLTEEQFHAVIDRFEAVYREEFKKLGGNLVINRRWTDSTVNASANRMGSNWYINMYGGLARHPAITADGFMIVICHEAGHHIGGAPKNGGWFGSWATNEGGSDYFATLKCMRRIFIEDDNEAILADAKIDPLVQERCESQFGDRVDQLICMRSSLAAMSVAMLFMDLNKDSKAPAFNTPDPKVVEKTSNSHPATQCRLDTYFAGSVCPVHYTIPQDDRDPLQGSCNEPVDAIGIRPRCWYKPSI